MNSGRLTPLFAALLPVLFAFPALAAQDGLYVEDFSSTAYRDAGATTAEWNTASGTLGLPDYAPLLLGGHATAGEASRIVADGRRAFLAMGASGLAVHDLLDDLFSLLGSSTVTALDVAPHGRHAFLAAGATGIVTLDLSAIGAIVPVDTLSAGMTDVTRVTVHGDLLFACDAAGLIHVVDVSQPDALASLSSFATAGAPGAVLAAGDLLYSGQSTRFYVHDITDPSSPVMLGLTSIGDVVEDLDRSGDVVLAAAGYGGIVAVDVGVPTAPAVGGALDVKDFAGGVDVHGDMAYVASGLSALFIADIRDPVFPAGHDAVSGGTYVEVAVVGDRAVVAESGGGVDVFAIADTPGEQQPAISGIGDDGFDVVVDGDFAYLTTDTALDVVDVSDPRNPVVLSSYSAANLRCVDADGDLVAVGQSTYLRLLDVSDPYAVTEVGSLLVASGTPIEDVVIAGDVVYTAWGMFTAVDISDPTAPTKLSDYNATAFDPVAIAVRGDLAFVADRSYDPNLVVLDVSDPSAPAPIGSYDPLGSSAVAVAAEGDLVYLSSESAIEILDVSDPTTPTRIRYISPAGIKSYDDLHLDGNMLLAANDIGGLAVFDVTTPASASQFYSGYDFDTRRVFVDGEYLFATSLGYGDPALVIAPLRHRRFVPGSNLARSLNLDASADAKLAVRLGSSQQDSIAWEASFNGTSWTDVTPGAGFVRMVAGPGVYWRSEHLVVDPYQNPVCTSLTVEWLYEHPQILSVEDVPGDQGGWARLRFLRSGYDFAAEATLPVAQYFVYRMVDTAARKPGEGLLRRVLTGPDGLPAETFWEIVASAPAHQQDEVVVLVPTLGDSGAVAAPTSYMVSAETTTPSVFFTSPPDSGWSLDNLAPSVPEGLVVTYEAGGNGLAWQESPDDDFRFFKIYRGTTPDFAVDPLNPLHATTGTAWTDPAGGGDDFYRVSAVDFAGNESEAALQQGLTGIGGPSLRFALHRNAPNPFNPRTTLSFSLPEASQVTLRVYDLSGRLVRTLLDGAPHERGRHEAVWDGRDDGGRVLAAGSYVARLEAGGRGAALRMTLVK